MFHIGSLYEKWENMAFIRPNKAMQGLLVIGVVIKVQEGARIQDCLWNQKMLEIVDIWIAWSQMAFKRSIKAAIKAEIWRKVVSQQESVEGKKCLTI